MAVEACLTVDRCNKFDKIKTFCIYVEFFFFILFSDYKTL